MKPWSKSEGLIAATLTPFHDNGDLNLSVINAYVDHLVKTGVNQVFVNGTAAEHANLTVDERKELAAEWMKHGRSKLSRIIIHCGAGNLHDTKELVSHAERIVADCVAVIAPTYYTTNDIVRLTDFLSAANDKIPTLIGAKCTSMDLYDASSSARLFGGKFDVPIGADYQLGALAMGLRSGVGISYSFLGRPFNRMIGYFDQGDMARARVEQQTVHDFWDFSGANTGIHGMIANFKDVMSMCGVSVGPPRLPIRPNSAQRKMQLKQRLDQTKFFDWV